MVYYGLDWQKRVYNFQVNVVDDWARGPGEDWEESAATGCEIACEGFETPVQDLISARSLRKTGDNADCS